MVAIQKIIASIALFSASVLASPLDRHLTRRQADTLTCLLTPAVGDALTCLITGGCLADISTGSSNLGTCVLECVRNLTNTEIVSQSPLIASIRADANIYF
jgi:hypothetical protein